MSTIGLPYPLSLLSREHSLQGNDLRDDKVILYNYRRFGHSSQVNLLNLMFYVLNYVSYSFEKAVTIFSLLGNNNRTVHLINIIYLIL